MTFSSNRDKMGVFFCLGMDINITAKRLYHREHLFIKILFITVMFYTI